MRPHLLTVQNQTANGVCRAVNQGGWLARLHNKLKWLANDIVSKQNEVLHYNGGATEINGTAKSSIENLHCQGEAIAIA